MQSKYALAVLRSQTSVPSKTALFPNHLTNPLVQLQQAMTMATTTNNNHINHKTNAGNNHGNNIVTATTKTTTSNDNDQQE